MKHLYKTFAAKTLLYSLSLFLMLTTSSLAQEIDRSTTEQSVNQGVDVSVHPDVTGQSIAQPSNSRSVAPASTFGASRAKPLSATTDFRIAPKAQAPPMQPLNSTNQGGPSNTQLNAGTAVPKKHVAHSSAGPAPPPSRSGFAAKQSRLVGFQSSVNSVHHSGGKRSAHASNKLFTSKHDSLDAGMAIKSKSSAAHSPKAKLDK
jgi:hypothetical protein